MPAESGAVTPTRPNWLSRELRDHVRVCVGALGRLWRDASGTTLTVLVIGLTLALPATLHLFVTNLQRAAGGLNQTRSITLFLGDFVSESAGRDLARQLSGRSGIAQADYVSREAALAEFRTRTGMSDVMDALGSNPLPASIAVLPAESLSAGEVAELVAELRDRPDVEQAREDGAWMQRLEATLAVANRVALLLAIALGTVVVIVVGNTIRLDIESRRDELIVLRLIGAPNGFIRRPFLWAGLWYGLFGGLLAVVAVGVAALAVSGPVGRLVELYAGAVEADGPSVDAMFLLIAAGLVLGLGGAWMAASRHLMRDEFR
ncbi:MAG TPA: permease-like cell division protein FtsX [Nevskiaceae bacterium]|nr:permease-like cell division protein FtsX [Nevskiaceae bacterium]